MRGPLELIYDEIGEQERPTFQEDLEAAPIEELAQTQKVLGLIGGTATFFSALATTTLLDGGFTRIELKDEDPSVIARSLKAIGEVSLNAPITVMAVVPGVVAVESGVLWWRVRKWRQKRTGEVETSS